MIGLILPAVPGVVPPEIDGKIPREIPVRAGGHREIRAAVKLQGSTSEFTVGRAYLRIPVAGDGFWGLLRICERTTPVWPIEVKHQFSILIYAVGRDTVP